MLSDPTILEFVMVSLIIGIGCGLLPYVLGKVYEMPKHGKTGLILCIVGGLVGGLFIALPVALIFSGFILYKSR